MDFHFWFIDFHAWKKRKIFGTGGAGFWIRLFGRGFRVTNSDMLFSERNGYKKYIKLPFGYRLTFFGDNTWGRVTKDKDWVIVYSKSGHYKNGSPLGELLCKDVDEVARAISIYGIEDPVVKPFKKKLNVKRLDMTKSDIRHIYIPPLDSIILLHNTTEIDQTVLFFPFLFSVVGTPHEIIVPSKTNIQIDVLEGSVYEHFRGCTAELPLGVDLEIKLSQDDAKTMESVMEYLNQAPEFSKESLKEITETLNSSLDAFREKNVLELENNLREGFMGCLPPGSPLPSPGNPRAFDPLDLLLKEKALKEQSFQNWISVDESLPENGLEVDVICEARYGKTSAIGRNLERHEFTGVFERSTGWRIWFQKSGCDPVICWRYKDDETRKILDHKPPKQTEQTEEDE